MDNQTLKFVIVGHVDHGKSTLIGRLLYDTNSLPPDKMEEIRNTSKDLGRDTEFAYLLDHLEEERRQGITIDTTQVFFKTDKREYVIIDAPGHVEFVKNMITGASQAEAAILIIDAKEGIQEQTKRHATILSMLGIEQVIVLINKADLIDFSEEKYTELRTKLEKFLTTLNITPKLYIPISALKGDNIANKSTNMPWYKGPTMLESLDLLKNKVAEENQPLIFPVQDIYKVDDKRIIVGRVETGEIREGQEVKILPEGQTTKVKTIEKYLESPKRASAQESTGITTEDAVFLDRGNILCEKDKAPKVSDRFHASVFWMSKQGYSKDEKVILRCATQEVSCKIEAIHKRINSSSLELLETDAQGLENLEIGEVTIKTKKPIVIDTFKNIREIGRFVLVKNENISAGGIITNTE
ncbi:MAG: GTP-binding protein [Candidatus Omnitrophota bacterium]|nr:GTP-binding protein [Candidatus Omnitrophota bacterium]